MTRNMVAVLHTVPSTIQQMKTLLTDALPGWTIINMLDDSILPMLREDPDTLPYVMEKLTVFCTFAQRQGACGILSACSSIGEITEAAKRQVTIPVMRIDEAMMTAAAQSAEPVTICATAPTTLGPSARLLREKGLEQFDELLLEQAAAFTARQNQDGHDRFIADQLRPILEKGGLVVLCQASMAAAQRFLSDRFCGQILTSPASGAALFAERMLQNGSV